MRVRSVFFKKFFVSFSNVPDDAVAISYATAMVNHAASGWMAAWPEGAFPGNSVGLFNVGVNGQTSGLAKIGSDGQIRFRASSAVDLAFDVDGYFATRVGLGFVPTQFPDRFLDSRGKGFFDTAGRTLNLRVAGVTGPNGIQVPATAQVVVCTATFVR